MDYSQDLQNKILDYYRRYYKSCGLRDAEQRAQRRLREEEVELKRMKRLERILNIRFSPPQKHFIFGAGTGGLAVILARQFGCEVYGIEPCGEEFEIIQAKLKEAGAGASGFKKEFGEDLSFRDNQFDFVHCFTVLEHVRDVERCIQEMVRVAKPGGFVYINTPNYGYPEERHYKIVFPTFLPKVFGYLYLLLRRRPLKFLKSINFIAERELNGILSKQRNITWLRIYEPLVREKGLKGWGLNFFKFSLSVYPKQEVIIKKEGKP